MDFAFIIPFLVVVTGNSFYHFLSKSISQYLNPFLGLTVTYGFAFLLSIGLFLFTRTDNFSIEISKLNWVNFAMGAAVLAIESGWIILYRSGCDISKGSLFANICISTVLFLLGFFFFHESITIKKFIGLAVCLIGVYLMSAT
ncbi:hypothetical protein [Dialister micraerophilus]|uniref:EamA domain-containing protein n=1 Tax=Dialister micraerophilus UPII 345-E TaxID=910314 RepID=E4L8L4_9FIRM|nr:hypothetical protein [Dialister micraerophilus]EFR42878.1 hypothetical protein HMPREF9220_0688 [Dialister micraerophilus UPII 345-E]MDK8253344.1 hypothetical protein [Dialister micraerophilus]